MGIFAIIVFATFGLAGCGGGGGSSSAMPAAVTALAGQPVAGGTVTANPAATASPGHSGTATAAPVTAATPTPAPTTGTNALTVSTFNGLTNAADYALGFAPYGASSPFNMPISSNPTYLATSGQIVANQFPTSGDSTLATRSNEAGQYDYNHPRFFAKATDPTVSVACTQYCGATDNGGVPATMHVPAVARPAGGGDSHFDVVQPDGTDISMWATSKPNGNWTTGMTVSAANIANCGNFASGAGWLPNGPGPTAAGYCTNAGIITAAELVAGNIQHALFITGPCAIGAQYPTERGASTQQCTSGIGPPLGGREWYDVPCATTRLQGLPNWETAELCALNVYGGYMADNGNGGAYFVGGLTGQVESDEPWYDYNGANYTSPFAALAAQGWTSASISNVYGSTAGTRWFSPNGWNPGSAYWQAHIHWLAPCSAQGTC